MCDESIEFQRTRSYYLMHMKTEELGLKENCGFQTLGIKDSQGNIILVQRQVLKIGENYITELHDLLNQPEDIAVEHVEEVHEDEKGPCPVKQKNYEEDEG
jgi:hypothetical protein